MRLAMMFLDRGEGSDNFIYSHARVLANEIDLTCYLSVHNTLLSQFRALPCKIKSFDWARGKRELARAILTRRDPTGISDEINRDAPDMLLDTHRSWWSTVVHRHLDGSIPIAEVIHDVVPHPGAESVVNAFYGYLFPSVADIAVALAEYSYRELVRRYPRQVHISSKHGIFLPEDHVDTGAIASRRHKMLFLGRIDKYKGIEYLIEAYETAKRANPDIQLDIIGRGHVVPNVQRRIDKLEIGRVNRYVRDDEVKEAMATHGVMILPYTSASQSGVAAVALGNGIPCIATRVGAIPEQVIDGRNGILVPPRDAQALADAMLEMARSEDRVREMADEAVRIGREDYSWEIISRRLLNDLQAYLDSPVRERDSARKRRRSSSKGL